MHEFTDEQKAAIEAHKEAFKNKHGWIPLNGSPVAIYHDFGVEILEGVIYDATKKGNME